MIEYVHLLLEKPTNEQTFNYCVSNTTYVQIIN